MTAARLAAAALVLGMLLPPLARAQGSRPEREEESQAPTACVACHSDPEEWDPEELEIVEAMQQGVHGEAGLSCHDCHGGNPDPELADDEDAAMDEAYGPNPFLGVPARTEIPELCGGCHADAEFMKRFDPNLRVDQLQEYRTSRHGKLLAEGDANVATCVDCHGAHGVQAPSAPESPVYATHVAETCSGCHADAEHMAGYTLEDGRPLPTDQYARWQRSVHAAALLERGDFSAPTCNDCHGNHGATPPGVESIAFVCGQCHGREADLFRETRKHQGFEYHNADLEEGWACSECHDPPEPAAAVTDLGRFTECATCHGNHAVVSPRISMLAPLPDVPCAFCHEPGPGGAPVPEAPGVVEHYREVRDRLVEQARAEGLEGTALFDRLVGAARELPFHTTQVGDGGRALRPEFQRLFDKFRLGKTTFTYADPATGEEVREPMVRCTRCHAVAGEGAEEEAGAATAQRLLDGLHEVTAWTARAERIALRARRGGVSTRDAEEAIDAAVDAQIQMQVLVHAFRAGEGSPFAEKQAEALGHARQALEEGEAALADLEFRRQGLAASLVVIALVLVGLALKIRSLEE